MNIFIWFGIFFCITQSAMFSGLNLAFFSVSRLRLEIETAKDNRHARKILAMREDANFLLTTILWGNVGINVLLTLLSNSVMAGVTAFLFSTVLITFLGEIIPQAYFSRHAMRTAFLFAPVLRFYQLLLYPVTKPTAVMLDKWLGTEAILFFKEEDLQELFRLHIESDSSDIDKVEGTGALNFLALDDLPVETEGEFIDPKSIITLSFDGGRPVFPLFETEARDVFLSKINASGKKWVVITDSEGEPRSVINADGFLRDALLDPTDFNPYLYCHRPIIIREPYIPLGAIILRLKVHPTRADDDVVDEDIILYWGETKRIITGSDILGRLLRGIVKQEKVRYKKFIPEEAYTKP
jgi:metal transporter CNNM